MDRFCCCFSRDGMKLPASELQTKPLHPSERFHMGQQAEWLRACLGGGQSLDEIVAFLHTRNGRCAVMQWALLSHLHKASDGKFNAREHPAVRALFASDEGLESFLMSGGCSDWLAAVKLLGDILAADPSVMSSSFRLRVAVAVALCFTTAEPDENMREEPINPVQRYANVCLGMEAGLLFGECHSLASWQWRYVVGSWHADSCLAWAREHVDEGVRCPDKIGHAAYMVQYRETNEHGVSVHTGLEFYEGKKSTMAVMREYGGVCGAVSKFGTSACQAFGVPAMPVAQPAHCAMIWRTPGGEWVLENDAGGWGQTWMHKGIQRAWHELDSDDARLVVVMEKAQSMPSQYFLSERCRLAAPLVGGALREAAFLLEAISCCPYNLPAWESLFCKLPEEEPARGELGKAVSKKLAAVSALIGNSRYDVSRFKPVAASDDVKRAGNLVDGSSSEWFPESPEPQWITIDLQARCQIHEVRVQWWGDYGAKTSLTLLSGQSANGEFAVRGERQGSPDSELNGWSSFQGWKEPTQMVRLELGCPSPDCFGLGKQYGLRQVCVLGHYAGPEEDSQSAVTLEASLLRWAERVFSSAETADTHAFWFVRKSLPTPCSSLLKPLRPTRFSEGIDLWLTAGTPQLRRDCGKWYYECRLGSGLNDAQIGWATEQFETSRHCSGAGVGDDEHSWAADGLRHIKWHVQQEEVQWPEQWAENDIVGCAIDVDGGTMSFSHNGIWVPAAGFEFRAADHSFYPAASMRGQFAFLLTSEAFIFSPPSDLYQALMGPECACGVAERPT